MIRALLDRTRYRISTCPLLSLQTTFFRAAGQTTDRWRPLKHGRFAKIANIIALSALWFRSTEGRAPAGDIPIDSYRTLVVWDQGRDSPVERPTDGVPSNRACETLDSVVFCLCGYLAQSTNFDGPWAEYREQRADGIRPRATPRRLASPRNSPNPPSERPPDGSPLKVAIFSSPNSNGRPGLPSRREGGPPRAPYPIPDARYHLPSPGGAPLKSVAQLRRVGVPEAPPTRIGGARGRSAFPKLAGRGAGASGAPPTRR